MREFDWIEKYFSPLADEPMALGLRDDAAYVNELKHTVIASDTLVAGVHFKKGTPPDLIAHKALRVNLSDMAAMGAAPYAYLLNLALPNATPELWVATFAEGLKQEQDAFGITLLGGDTTQTSGPSVISVTMLGKAEDGTLLRRDGAKEGDVVVVSGTIGDAYLGLKNWDASCIEQYQLPTPRVALGQALRGLATSCIDISDGLLQDAEHLCRASGFGMRLNSHAIPLSESAQAWLKKHLLETLLNAGDDYELLFTIPHERQAELSHISEQTGLWLSVIGNVVKGEGVIVLDEDANEIRMSTKGWQHF